MKITVTGRGIEVRDNVRDYAEQKAAKLEKFDDSLQKVEVLLSQNGDDRVVEMIAVPRRGGRVVAQAEHEEVYAAIDLVLDKMSQQLRKSKEKKEDKRKRSGRMPPPPLPSDEVEDEPPPPSYQDVVDEFAEKLDS